MTFRFDALIDAFAARGDKGFGVWTYDTTDPLEEVLQPGYFARATRILRTGDLIFLGIAPCRTRRPG